MWVCVCVCALCAWVCMRVGVCERKCMQGGVCVFVCERDLRARDSVCAGVCVCVWVCVCACVCVSVCLSVCVCVSSDWIGVSAVVWGGVGVGRHVCGGRSVAEWEGAIERA